jgi:hypothetical protein
MNPRTLIVFLFAACCFVSCGKHEPPNPNPPPNTFTISGSIHDLTIDSSSTAILPLAIAAATGDSQQAVSVWWVYGFPRGIYCAATPHDGITDFTTSITFSHDGVWDTAAPGTYPIKVVCTSTSDTQTYDCNLTVPPFNGFTLNGAYMRTKTMSHTTNTVSITSNRYDGGTLIGNNPAAWPTADGTYTYMVGAAAGKSLNFAYTPKNASYPTYETAGQGGADTAVVTISGGKMSIKSGLLHVRYFLPPNGITVNARE